MRAHDLTETRDSRHIYLRIRDRIIPMLSDGTDTVHLCNALRRVFQTEADAYMARYPSKIITAITVFVTVDPTIPEDRATGSYAMYPDGKVMLTVRLPLRWWTDNDSWPGSSRVAHWLADTFTHELLHAYQEHRVGSNLTGRYDARRVRGAELMHRHAADREARWGMPAPDSPRYADMHDDARTKLRQGEYLSRYSEIETFAMGLANDLLLRSGEDPKQARRLFVDLVRQGRDSVLGSRLQDYMQVVRKNPYLDTSQAWRSFLKMVWRKIATTEH